MSHTLFLCISAGAMLPPALTSRLELLAFTSFAGVFSSLFLFVVVIYTGAGSTTPGSYLHPQPTSLLGPTESLSLGIGLVMVGFAGHAVFPSIYTSMKDKSKFSRAVDCIYAIVVSVYVAVSVMGYLMYGNEADQEVRAAGCARLRARQRTRSARRRSRPACSSTPRCWRS